MDKFWDMYPEYPFIAIIFRSLRDANGVMVIVVGNG